MCASFSGVSQRVETCRQYTHKHCTYSAVQFVRKCGTHRTRLAQELQCHLCAPEKKLSSGPHMSHPLLLCHLPFTTSTSSSSFTLPSTTTLEHALHSGQHDLLQEHPVHHQPLQDLPVDKISLSTIVLGVENSIQNTNHHLF